MIQIALLSIPQSSLRRKENKLCLDSSKNTTKTFWGKDFLDKYNNNNKKVILWHITKQQGTICPKVSNVFATCWQK